MAFDDLLKPLPGAPKGAPPQPLWPGSARRRGARFTPRGTGTVGFACVYVALDEMTPLLEISGVLRPPGSSIPLVFEPLVLLTVDGILTNILDVSDERVQSGLGTTLQELTGEWAIQQEAYLRGDGPIPPTQALGQSAYDARDVVGLKYRSSKNTPSGFSIVVFTERLAEGRSYLEVFNKPGGILRQRLP